MSYSTKMANTTAKLSKPTLYYVHASPPSQTVIALSRLLNIDLDLKEIDYHGGEHKTAQFIKINPFKCVPVFVDTDGFKVSESRAIATYLVQSRCPESSLYPNKDVQKRALIDMFMHFELGNFYRAMTDVTDNFWTTGMIKCSKMPRLEEMFEMFDSLLSQNTTTFIAGDQLTVADLSMYFNLRLLEVFPEIDTSIYQTIFAWKQAVAETLKPINSDGFFDKAATTLKGLADMVRINVKLN